MFNIQNCDISLPELNELLKSPKDTYLLLDVRTVEEFSHGHLPGSVNIPVADLEQRNAELSKELPMVIVCHAGVRSEYALEILAEKGFTKIRHLPGGLMRLGYP
jgi:rhodanese-related sulfurtransferase